MATGDPLIGKTVAGRYRVIKLLGEGGMGAVYLAEHVAIEKKIALKVLHAEYAAKGDIVTRFQQEAISASRIKHPNVLEIFDFGQLESGAFYLAMEFLEGNDLADEIQRHHVLEPARGLRFAQQICRALAAAHAKGVVHRDMKPENVFLQRTPDGEELVKIVDFGIAQLRTNEEAAASSKQRRLTRTGMIFGTPEYMSPEQAGGKHADQRADIYAVGIILYEMFTGAVPFTGETFLGVLAKHLNDTAPPMSAVYPELGISTELQTVIHRALEKRPEERFQSMNELSQALGRTPEGRGVFRGRAAVQASATEFHDYSAVPSGAFTEPQFRNQSGAESHAPTIAHSGLLASSSPPLTEPSQAASQPGIPAGATGAPLLEPQTAAPREGTHAATTSSVEPGKSRAGVVAALAFALVAAGVIALVVKRGVSLDPPPERPVAAETPAPPKPTEPPVVAPPALVVTAIVTGSAPPAPPATVLPSSSVKLSVVTEPPGAMLNKDGFQVCDKTPCEVLAAPNETLELEAKKDGMTGKAKVLAQRDQNVRIVLAAAPVGKKAPTSGRLCEVEVDGIKILRACP
ncbi:MAG TPA: serine/threonine-protein kinase [Polyangiaceae bacterium]|nr:serine/threonine-protein kinase [Polyangiaceae bacterium]